MTTKRTPARLLTLAALTSLGLASFTATAQPAAAPEVEASQVDSASRAKALEIIEKYIAAIGGREALENAKSIRMSADVVFKGMPMDGTMEVILIPDGPMIQKMTINTGAPGAPAMENVAGSDGTRGYNFSTMTGAELMPAEMHDQIHRDANPTSIINIADHYPTIEFVGEGEFNGQAVNTIRVVDDNDMESTQHYSIETGLLLGGQSQQQSQMGPMQITSTVTNYKEFGGIKMAVNTEVNMGAMIMELTVKSVEFNNATAEDIEHPPAAIKILQRAAERDAKKAAGEG